MSKLASNAENYLWNCFKFYLMTRRTCLCDNVLNIVNSASDDPTIRYSDFNNSLNEHFGLSSYVAGQSAQFSRFPYIVMNVDALDRGNCYSRVILSFDVIYGVDTPEGTDNDSVHPGNSSEAIAQFKSNICDALDELMYEAFNDGNKHYSKQAFFDALRDTSWVNPITKTGTAKAWKYNVVGHVEDSVDISEVMQLKKEDRGSSCLVFTVVYNLDIYKLYGNGIDCGC